MSTPPSPEDDDTDRLVIALAKELLTEHGQQALGTFAALFDWAALHPDQDWQQELEDGIAALRQGHHEQVAARLAVLSSGST